ncbi:hypothetical protein JCM5350_003458 [Sporobolomyces pararoseus]
MWLSKSLATLDDLHGQLCPRPGGVLLPGWVLNMSPDSGEHGRPERKHGPEFEHLVQQDFNDGRNYRTRREQVALWKRKQRDEKIKHQRAQNPSRQPYLGPQQPLPPAVVTSGPAPNLDYLPLHFLEHQAESSFSSNSVHPSSAGLPYYDSNLSSSHSAAGTNLHGLHWLDSTIAALQPHRDIPTHPFILPDRQSEHYAPEQESEHPAFEGTAHQGGSPSQHSLRTGSLLCLSYRQRGRYSDL